MKKLSKQKRCYEEIIAYFKQEMGLMADQLNNLQELLVSWRSTHFSKIQFYFENFQIKGN